MIILWVISLLFFPNFSSVLAFTATSTSFTVLQGIQSLLSGNSSQSFSTSTTFILFGAGGEAAVGNGTSTSFINDSGIFAAIGKSKNATAGTSLTFTIDSNTKSFGTLSPNVLASDSSSLYVTTDNPSGFTASVVRVDADATLDLTTNALTNIPDKTSWNAGANCASAGNATASTTEAQTLQFRIRQSGTDSSNYCSAWWGSGDTTATALFAGFPSSSEDIVYRSSSALSQVTSVVLYNLNVPVTQETGDYTGSITYTVVANP